MATNLTGPMLLTKAVAPIMKAQGRGRIVNIASVAGLSPTGSSIAYAVSKAGLIHLTRCMAVALAPETLVNCVAPGLLDGTRATANLRSEQIERIRSEFAPEEAGRQGRLRRHGGRHVSHRDHDRPRPSSSTPDASSIETRNARPNSQPTNATATSGRRRDVG